MHDFIGHKWRPMVDICLAHRREKFIFKIIQIKLSLRFMSISISFCLFFLLLNFVGTQKTT